MLKMWTKTRRICGGWLHMMSESVVNLSGSSASKGGAEVLMAPSPRKRQRPRLPSTSDKDDERLEKFLQSGYCVIPNALPLAFVATCLRQAKSDMKLVSDALEVKKMAAIQSSDCHKLAATQRVDFREVVDRDGGRRDVRLKMHEYPWSAPGLTYNTKVFPIVKELLGGGPITLLYTGIMWARRKNPEHQKWHGDGGHLFEHTHLPPHCINVFFPLVNLTPANGPTEVDPGTHKLGCFSESLHSPQKLLGDAGDAILFDYRLKHRGCGNSSDSDRPILYLAFSKPWFRDSGNTRSGFSLFDKPSAPWISRLLDSEVTDVSGGFDPPMGEKLGDSNINGDVQGGAGERWILFKMNVELDGGRDRVITVHNGDIAEEVATRFCIENSLGKDFIDVLSKSIEEQIVQCHSPT